LIYEGRQKDEISYGQIKKRGDSMKKIIIIGLFFLFLSCQIAYAGQVFVWTDDKGETHYSDTQPSNWERTKYESFETPEMARARRQREIEETQRDLAIKNMEAQERQKALELEKRKKRENEEQRL
jgi:hypothetical protein